MTCIRDHVTIDEAGWRLAPNAERRLKSPAEMAALFADHPQAVANTRRIADACTFSLDELRYEYPAAELAPGATPQSELERLTWTGAKERYPDGIPTKIHRQIEHEFAIVGTLGYAPYFLTVHDIVRFARSRGILCQGRGSAANSAVCYCLGITAVDPSITDLLFERFISPERGEPPDIDVDFEHERREEVIQYIYEKYGRDKAGLTAVVTTYRTRSAVREVGKVMGLSQDVLGALVATLWGSGRGGIGEERVREAGLDPADTRLALTLSLAEELIGFPRHLSQHVGGFVLTRGPLHEVVPIENAAMEDRTVIEWDKDDLDALGILKIDVLSLGMLTCIRKALTMLGDHYGRPMGLADLPQEDPETYEMLSRGDSLGVFQVESRAQMSMLPRLRPNCFYDLVIEVAIVRPGPIQGDMVHPYLRRRQGKEGVRYPSGDLRKVLERTLGVPLFQEQAMQIAIVGAGFSPAEADGPAQGHGDLPPHRPDRRLQGAVPLRHGGERLRPGLRRTLLLANRGIRRIRFPRKPRRQLRAAGLRLGLAQAALPGGLRLRPAQQPADGLLCSGADPPRRGGARGGGASGRHQPEPLGQHPGAGEPHPARRLRPAARVPAGQGARPGRGRGHRDGAGVLRRRKPGSPPLPQPARGVWRRARVSPETLDRLARADAFAGLGHDRRRALWDLKVITADPLPLFAAAEGAEFGREEEVYLPDIPPGEQVVEDYAALRLSLRDHPLGLLRARLELRDCVRARQLAALRDGLTVRVAGLSICRQRPGSAHGVIFITLEDETGIANLILRPPVFEAHRRAVLRGSLLLVEGSLQKEGEVIHVIVSKLTDLTALLYHLAPGGAPSPGPVGAHPRRPGASQCGGRTPGMTGRRCVLSRTGRVRPWRLWP